MKILAPCMLTPLLLLSVAAQEKSRTLSQDFDFVNLSESRDKNRFETAAPEREAASMDSPDSFCAYLRTYRVKREAKGSDAVRPAGYSKCVPSARFTVKSAVLDDPSPTR